MGQIDSACHVVSHRQQGLENSSPVVPAPSLVVLVQKGNLSMAYNPQSIICFILSYF